MAGWKKKSFSKLFTKTHFRAKDTNRLKERGMEKIVNANANSKNAGVALLM